MVSATNASRAITVRSGFKKIVATLRSKQDRSALTSFIIVDAQSVKNTETAENKGYDAGKKISGIKRHLAVDMNGFPQAIHLTRANVSDRDGASAMLALNAENLRRVRSVLVDGGYSGRPRLHDQSHVSITLFLICVLLHELHLVLHELNQFDK